MLMEVQLINKLAMNNITKIILPVIVIFVLIILLLIFTNRNYKDYDFKIYFFNAGKADAIVLSKNDHYIMIDTGEESLSNEILEYFKKNNITKLDYLIITHFDKDHVGSASSIIDNIDVENVLQSNYPKDSEYYNNYVESLRNKNITAITVSDNYEFVISGLKITVNGPTGVYENNESNNSSLIVTVINDSKKFLFMGDSQNARIKDFLEISDTDYDFIKIPYHGHYLKRLDEILENNEIKYAVITSSDKELEDDETIEMLNNYNINCYFTRKGPVTILSNGEDIVIKQ